MTTELIARLRRLAERYSNQPIEETTEWKAASTLEAQERRIAELAAFVSAIRLQAEGSDWQRDSGESLEQWAVRTIRAKGKAEAALRECLAHADAMYAKARRVANGHDQIAAVEALDRALNSFSEWRAKHE